jgi:hypothetical protein
MKIILDVVEAVTIACFFGLALFPFMYVGINMLFNSL